MPKELNLARLLRVVANEINITRELIARPRADHRAMLQHALLLCALLHLQKKAASSRNGRHIDPEHIPDITRDFGEVEHLLRSRALRGTLASWRGRTVVSHKEPVRSLGARI